MDNGQRKNLDQRLDLLEDYLKATVDKVKTGITAKVQWLETSTDPRVVKLRKVCYAIEAAIDASCCLMSIAVGCYMLYKYCSFATTPAEDVTEFLACMVGSMFAPLVGLLFYRMARYYLKGAYSPVGILPEEDTGKTANTSDTAIQSKD